MMDSISVIRFHDLQGNEINQAMGLLDELENRTAVQQYSVQYMFEIIRKLVAEVRRLERVRYMMPVGIMISTKARRMVAFSSTLPLR